jgi:hypothetical protein
MCVSVWYMGLTVVHAAACADDDDGVEAMAEPAGDPSVHPPRMVAAPADAEAAGLLREVTLAAVALLRRLTEGEPPSQAALLAAGGLDHVRISHDRDAER